MLTNEEIDKMIHECQLKTVHLKRHEINFLKLVEDNDYFTNGQIDNLQKIFSRIKNK